MLLPFLKNVPPSLVQPARPFGGYIFQTPFERSPTKISPKQLWKEDLSNINC